MKKNKKNIAVIICCVVSAVAIVWASLSFIGTKNNTPEIETQINTYVTQNNKPPQKEEYIFKPHYTDSTNPEKYGLKTTIYSGNTKVDSYSSDKFDFGYDKNYTDAEGIITFRGNNFRDGAAYGSASLTNKKFSSVLWRAHTGSMESGSGYPAWTGSGWTGQPLIVKWDNETKNNMNIFPEKKAKENLVEAIYATMAGKIYFLDIEDGQFTREPMNLGYVFKGAGALDPRGYPIMYVGAGDYTPGGATPKMFIINLLDCTVMKQYNGADNVAHRTWGAFDSSALVCAETDTLIYPCENGLIYSIRLNSAYDKTNGKVSINPDEPVKFKVTTNRNGNSSYWYGFETSAVFYGQYMYIADNGGLLYCIDMKTFEVIWMQDVVDDTNSTPVLEIENGKPYIYISTSLHWTKKNGRGDIPVFKIDAETGEYVWKKVYNCATVEGTSGGVQGTIALGKNDCEDLIFVPLAHYPKTYQGGIAAINKKTGEEVWYYAENSYTWSSPSVITGSDGNSIVINCDLAGDIVMLDAKTGKLIDKISPGGIIEASPAFYNDMMIIGLRSSSIVGIKLT